MAEPVLMPKQGQSVETCIITEWYKKKGEAVTVGDMLFAYETDKASFEEEAKIEGILLEVFYGQGEEVPVLTNVAVIGKQGEPVDEFRPGGSKAETSGGDKTDKEVPVKEEKQEESEIVIDASPEVLIPTRHGKIIISPRAKKMADLKSVPYETIAGTGPEGRIIVRDIEKAIEEGVKLSPTARKAQKEEDLQIPAKGTGVAGTINYADLKAPENLAYGIDYEEVKLSNIRKLIGKAMYTSLQNTAQLTHHLSADASRLLELRKKIKTLQKDGFEHNITLNDMICFASIRAILRNPDANVHFLGDSVRKFRKVHLGLAVDTDRGLMVPALRNADDLSLTGLSSQLKTLAESCRTGKVNPDLLASTAGSFTISNLGNYGVEMFTPILNIPQAAILGVNTIINRFSPLKDGTFGFIPYLGLSLTYDHRALDGGPATKFLADIKYEIENFNTEII